MYILGISAYYHDSAAVLIRDRNIVAAAQEETTVLKIPCITMRENTEWPVTIKKGTNCLAGRDKKKIIKNVGDIVKDEKLKNSNIPEFWDGKTAKRIVNILLKSQ